MFISKLRVKNIKCFRDSEEIPICQGLNVFAGKNNSGKSALLNSLNLLGNIVFKAESHTFQDNFIRKYRNMSEPDARSEIILMLKPTVDEKRSFLGLKEIEFHFRDAWNEGKPYGMKVKRVIAIEANGNKIQLVEFGQSEKKYPLRTISDGKWDKTEISATPTSDLFPFDHLNKVKKSIFHISPHRVTPPSLIASESELLRIDPNNITNLHQVLLTLHSNYRKLYYEIEKFVCSVFGDIDRIETTMLKDPPNHTAVHLVQKHTGLKVPLAQSGTGIEQLLTICTLVMGSQESLIILLDEPHVFLHPKAEKKLVMLFEEYSQHQYFIATHSPIWINKAPWSSLHWITKEGGQSKSQSILTEETRDLEPIFHDLGVENSDWTSTDMMIFVEGGSDEKVYRALLSKMGYRKSLIVTSFVPIGGTGWIRAKTSNHFFKLCSAIVERLSKLRIGFFFVFDKHEEKNQSIKNLRSDYSDKVQLIPRYEIENFLLEPAAVVEAIKEEVELYCEDSDTKAKVLSNTTLDKIEEMFEKGIEDRNNYLNTSPDSSNWEKSIRGSSLLDSVYEKCGLSYDKTTSGPRIVDYLSPEFLDKIKEELDPVFKTILQ